MAITDFALSVSPATPLRRARKAAPERQPGPLDLFRIDISERIKIIRAGVPAATITQLAQSMQMPLGRVVEALGLARTTIDRKVKESKNLSADESERVLALVRLVGQVAAMVQESGNAENFDAANWTGRWLEQPLPALGNRAPLEYLDTGEGRQLVSNLLARMQSGALA